MPFTISHAKSLTIPDSTNTDIVRPVDWNSGHQITYSPSGAELFPAFSDGGNVSFSTNPSGYLVASAPAGGGGGGIAASAGSQVATTNTVVFANSNGISFGMSGSSQITASYTVPVQTAYQFDNSNGVSFGTNAGTVTASVRTDYQSAGAYLTTAANSTHSHGAISMSLAGGLSGTYSSASSGLTLSLTQAAGAASPINFSAGTISSSLTAVTFGDGGNVTFGLGTGVSAGVITASAPSGGAGGVVLSAGSQSIGTGTVAFANSNGISFGMSGSNQITASYTVPNVPAQTVQPVAVSGSNGSYAFSTLTLGSSNGMHFYTTNGSVVGSYTIPTVPGATVFSNSNNVSFGLNGSTITATATWPAQTVQPAVAQLNGSSGTLSIVAGSSLSASSNASTITLGLASNWSTTIMPLGNSTGYASSVLSNTFLTTAAQSGHSHGNPTLALTNLSGTTGSASNGFTLSLSAAAPGGGGGVAISAGSDSLFTSGTVSFGNANGFSFITSNGSIVGSYTDGGGAGGGFSAGISNLGNTANSSGTVASHIVFVGSNNITLAESVNANSATVTISGPNLNTWAIQQWPGALVGSTGSLTIISPGATTTTAGGSITTESVYLFPIVIPAQLEYNNVHVVQALAAPAAGTGSVTQIQAYALYSSNASTYSLMTDNSYVNIQYRSQNSVTAQSISMFFGTNSTTNTYTTNGNISASISGMRGASLTSGAGVSTIPAGSYLLAAAVLQSSAGGIAIQTLAHKQWIQHAFKDQPYGKAAQYQPWARHSGYITHTHSETYTPVIVFPNSFHISNISSATLGGNGVPLINFVRTDYPT